MEASNTDLITTCYGEVDENWRTVQFRTNKLEIMTEWRWVKPAQNKQMQYEKIRKQKTETNVFSISVRDSCCGFSRFKSTLLPFQVWLSIQVSAPCCANCDIRKKNDVFRAFLHLCFCGTEISASKRQIETKKQPINDGVRRMSMDELSWAVLVLGAIVQWISHDPSLEVWLEVVTCSP